MARASIRPLTSNLLVDRSEQQIAQDIQTRIELESQGTLNDFSSASPLTAIAQGQAYAIAQLGVNINQLPDAFVLKYLETLGLSQTLSRPSLVPIEFTRITGFSGSIQIPQGFRMFTREGIVFTLDDTLLIGQNSATAIGYATSAVRGLAANVDAFTITGYSLALPGLDSITNPVPARGGVNVEDPLNAIARGLSFLTFRHLTTPLDFERAAYGVLDKKYTVKALTYEEIQRFIYDGDRVNLIDTVDDLSRRHIYLVVSDNKGLSINDALQNKIRNYFLPRLPSGTEVKFLLPDPIEFNIEIQTTDNPNQNAIGRMVSSLGVDQSIEYQKIGSDLSVSRIHDVIRSFLNVKSITVTIPDDRGQVLLEYKQSNDRIPAAYPATVFLNNLIKVTTQNSITYTFENFAN